MSIELPPLGVHRKVSLLEPAHGLRRQRACPAVKQVRFDRSLWRRWVGALAAVG